MLDPEIRSKIHTLTGFFITILSLSWIVASAGSFSKVYLPLIQNPFIPPTLDHLLISEIMANPITGDVEWVELYNPTAAFVDLSNYKIGDEETIGGPEAMRQFPSSAVIESNQIIVLALDANVFQNTYGFLPDYEIVNTGSPVPDLFDYFPWANGPFSLANNGDELLLLDIHDDIVDSVAWGDSPWPDFTPPAINPGLGNTLERSPIYLDTDTASDWIEQPSPNPGTVNLTPPSPTPSASSTPTPFDGGLLISEVLYDPFTTEPNGEWIELFNATGTTIHLTGFKIGDEEIQGGSEGMYQFPDGSLISPDTVLIIANRAVDFQFTYGFAPNYELVDTDPIVPDMTKYIAWSNGSVALTNTGDELLLLDYNNNIVDAVSWGASNWAFDPPVPDVPEGHSIERVPADLDTNTYFDWKDQPTPDPGNANTDPPTATPTATLIPTPFTGLLLISEVLYDPTDTEPAAEWMEIYNASGQTLNLSAFKIGDAETQGESVESMYRFPDGATLVDGEVVVIANQAIAFFAAYGFNPDYELTPTDLSVPDMIEYTQWATGSVQLGNTGDEVLLLDGSDNLVDAVSWGTSTWAFDPPVPDVLQGHSIERNPANEDSNMNTDWMDRETPDPGYVSLVQ